MHNFSPKNAMVTITLAAYMRNELPPVNAALDSCIAPMPSSSRKVAEHVLHAGGKRLRPLLTILMARLLGHMADNVYPLAASVEMMHAATLLHDDVIDNASSRRGKTAAHKIFGQTQAILGGDALLARASSIVAEYNDIRLAACLAEMLEETSSGQILELERQNDGSLDLDAYFDVIRGKTAWMLRASCELGALLSGADPHAVSLAAEFGLQTGMAFQIIDDALDFAPSSKTGKPEGGDIREGKLTPPLFMYLDSLSGSARNDFAARFLARSFSDEDVRRISADIRSAGLDTAAKKMAIPYLDAAKDALENLRDGRPESKEGDMLEAVLAYVRDREL